MPDLDVLKETPPHLRAAQQAAGSPAPSSREQTFDFSWKDPSGKAWSGTFTSRIPSVGEQIDIAKRVAKRSHGAGDGPLPEDVGELIYTVAYLETVLVQRPAWAQDLESLPYVDIINGLAKEATAHLRNFRQPGSGQKTGD